MDPFKQPQIAHSWQTARLSVSDGCEAELDALQIVYHSGIKHHNVACGALH
jgi:hypothetical protein